MREDPLWLLVVNSLLGAFLIVWMLVTLGPFLLGFQPPLPGMEIAFVGSVIWAIVNARRIMRED